MPDIELTYRKVEGDYYDVFFGDARLGCVYRDRSAWSYGQWFIEGGRKADRRGGVNGIHVKPCGFSSRQRAAYELAVEMSSTIIHSLP